MKNLHVINENIYITNDEEIKEDYVFAYGVVIKVMMFDVETLYFVNRTKAKREDCKKIILTDDQDLIKDGIQAIPDEFLEWFVKNPSCEFVQPLRVPYFDESGFSYKIIIPKEEPKQDRTCTNNCSVVCGECQIFEPKQETLEEVRKVKRTELFNSIHSVVKQIPREGVETDAMDAPSCAYEIEQLFYKWHSERMYSEEESFENKSLKWWMSLSMEEQVEIGLKYNEPTFNLTLRAIMFEFEQFKKK